MTVPRSAVAEPVFSSREAVRGLAVFLTIAIVGLFVVKWQPYYARTFAAAATHTLGRSILTAGAAAPPAATLQAAWEYGVAYFESVWQAMLLGLVLAATIQTVLPRQVVARLLGSLGVRSTLLAGAASLPSMMCTCCAAPVAIGLRRRGASTAAAVAYYLGNPTLNPAVLVFAALTLGWRWAALRLLLGLVLVAGGAALAVRWSRDDPGPGFAEPTDVAADRPWPIAWLRALLGLALRLVPEYVLVVGLLGLARAWVFPTAGPDMGNSLLVMVPLAVAGMLFVIPTAGEIPIIQSMLGFGVGAGPLGVLLLTLAPLSLPSLLMMARVVPGRIVIGLAAGVVLIGLLAGTIAIAAGLA